MSEPSIQGYFTLKSGEGFALLDPEGRIRPGGPGGLVWRNMRHVSGLEPLLGGKPLLFEASAADDNGLRFTYINDAFTDETGTAVPAGAIKLTRELVMAGGRLHEKLALENKTGTPVNTRLEMALQADFADIFDIRSASAKQRGARQAPEADRRRLSARYNWQNGRDSSLAVFAFSRDPDFSDDKAGFDLALKPGRSQTLYGAYGPVAGGLEQTGAKSFAAARRAVKAENARLDRYGPRISSSAPAFDRALGQSFRDLSQLCADLDTGLYPFAGLPWFSTPFGRDGTITALLTMGFYPAIAKGVLALQAKMQATEHDKFRQAEPGKIFHEIRPGSESAANNENPFAAYYGGADTTPLFVVLANAYLERTGDKDFVKTIWPQLQKALGWVRDNMDKNGGYVRYSYDKNGLTQQGWKDSADSIIHADAPDELPKDPIALCEVQAYAYGALRAGEKFARAYGDAALADDCRARADDLYARFNREFWLDDLQTYALALDGNDRPCEVQSSNAGHAYLTGIVPQERAAALARTLLDEKSFSGFGIRTLAQGPGYDPLSYHRGSVWPHDTALVALGMGQYGLKAETAQILDGLIAASTDDPRLPELFSGAQRQGNKAKEPYPSACSPQAWAAASLLGALHACLQPQFNCAGGAVKVKDAQLPPSAGKVNIRGWQAATGNPALKMS